MAKLDLLHDEDVEGGSSGDKSAKKTTAKAINDTTSGVTSTKTPSSNTNYCHLSEVRKTQITFWQWL